MTRAHRRLPRTICGVTTRRLQLLLLSFAVGDADIHHHTQDEYGNHSCVGRRKIHVDHVSDHR